MNAIPGTRGLRWLLLVSASLSAIALFLLATATSNTGLFATGYDTLLIDAGAVRAAYLAACSTVGSRVRVSLPDGSTLDGDATDVDEHGRLVVDGRPITAGDVVHVRS